MMWSMKSYGQRCPVSRALDVIGDRWALLVLRELELGPKRYTDLLAGLPGVGTNVLSARLHDLEAAGVIEKRTLPPPTQVTVYEPTEAGKAAGPVLHALRDWGGRHGRPVAAGDAARASWMLAPLARRQPKLASGRVCELRVGDEVFQIRSGRDGLSIRGGGAESPDATVSLALGDLHALVSGSSSARAVRAQAEIDGDSETADQLLQALAEA
jgi:DNA-binding HxlR family transcriptional regulator